MLCLDSADAAKKAKIQSLGVRLWEMPESDGHLSWSAFRARCAEAGICGVYVEAGPSLATALMEQGRLDYLYIYKAPKFMADAEAKGIGTKRQTASMADALHLEQVQHEILGDDVLTRGRLVS